MNSHSITLASFQESIKNQALYLTFMCKQTVQVHRHSRDIVETKISKPAVNVLVFYMINYSYRYRYIYLHIVHSATYWPHLYADASGSFSFCHYTRNLVSVTKRHFIVFISRSPFCSKRPSGTAASLMVGKWWIFWSQ